MGRRVWKGQNDNWNTILSRKEFRREKAFANRETRLRNTTTSFLSNLPNTCNRDSLWQAFGHFNNLEDAFVPFKKDRSGNKFGFLKLSNVKEPEECIDSLKKVRIDGAVVGVNIAKYNRDGSKVDPNNSGNRVFVFERLHGLVQSSNLVEAMPGPGIDQHRKKTYCSVVKASGVENMVTISLPPMNSVTKKSLEFKSLIGEVKDIDILNNLKVFLSGITEEGLNLKYLGGLKVLLCFNSPEEVEDFRYSKMELWEKWFSRLYLWEGIPPIFERIAWIKILGVPLSLWDHHVINKIGERCSRILVKSEADASDGNMAKDRLAILVNTGKRISSEFNLFGRIKV
ncbi:putative RNA recognition motif domain, nucleotide-binding alpha-beta plait domain superfamily [Helianthus annuus]|uniref:RNA recognition motif domain, nucleotide-binding alpha-beta plait domain superfamily n=1 Tax=Helianthus annuus TaxID=4232 RepID=A0A9K3DNF6_HELAN|nr:putative RNA recognition motif domain, nucleotide-binding alpha-beta plait domain superfamily [Helianthus annuus]KAJ0459141.1 putative RNA recognition motif domain, nucleotide-binding alpha-beta plait domain superfamily [Helianthus annuus]KAJ0815581.1 putative RNA recognition motif domain, nucleotide-binding alpha-beta plait domain superfamily [Helianthus annuus]